MIARVAWWKEACFRSEPRARWLPRDARVWRAWSLGRVGKDGALQAGDRTASMYGSGFFNPRKPQSVIEAEMQGDIVRWGNLVAWVTEFEVIQGLYVYRGLLSHDAEPTDAQYANVEQIFVKGMTSGEIMRHFREVPGSTASLASTGWVAPRTGSA